MLRYCLVIVSLTGLTFAGYPDSHYGNDIGSGQSYGFSGSFSGNGQPNFPGNFGGPQFYFPGFLGSLQRYHQEFVRNIQAAAQGYGQGGAGGGGSYGGGYGGGTGGAYGGSFSGPGNAGYAPGGGGFAPNGGGAVSTAFIGPGGAHQTASVYPENPISPNIDTRFGASDQPGGFHSVFTSSQSETNNIGGKPYTVERAQTTINDNGRITTYTAKNP